MSHIIRYTFIDSEQFQGKADELIDDEEFKKILDVVSCTAKTYDDAKKLAEEFAKAFPNKAPFYIVQVMQSTSIVGKVEAKDV